MRRFDEDRGLIRQFGGRAASALRIHESLRRRPVTRIRDLMDSTGLSRPTVRGVIDELQRVGIVVRLEAERRPLVFAYDACLRILNEGTEAP